MESRLKRLERLNRLLFTGLALALLPWVVGAATKVPELIEAVKGKFDTIEAQRVALTGKTMAQASSSRTATARPGCSWPLERKPEPYVRR